MKIYKCEDLIRVGDAPVGLFIIEDCGEIICISEYRSGPDSKPQHEWSRDAIIVSSGENYCGEGDEALGYSLVIS